MHFSKLFTSTYIYLHSSFYLAATIVNQFLSELMTSILSITVALNDAGLQANPS